MTSQSYPNTTSATLTYDAADRLSGITHKAGTTAFLSFSHTRDNIGQLTSENTKTFGYDLTDRLTTWTEAPTTTTYGYDAADRLTQIAPTASPVKTLAYDVADQLGSVTTMDGATQVGKLTYSYDSRGNRVQQTDQVSLVSTNLGYDQANRLTSFGPNATYAYNGDGLRMSKTVAAAVQPFTWNVAQGLPLLLQDDAASVVYGLGRQPLEQIDGSGVVLYFHQDQLGSTRALTDAIGVAVATFDYDAYGNLTSPPPGGVTTPLQYTGEYTDAESGLIYLRARYYEPSTGQFISRDPMVATTREPYGYVGGDPLNHIDPAGHAGEDTKHRSGDAWDVVPPKIVRPAARDVRAQMEIQAGLENYQSVRFNYRDSARSAFPEGSALQQASNRFFRQASGKCGDFTIEKIPGRYRLSYTAPARNEGYAKTYVREIDDYFATTTMDYKVGTYLGEAYQVKGLSGHGWF
jgi:RHS repeat-associated protein